MEQQELLAKIAKILNQLEIPYVVTGGIALAVWGRPRFTADIDIVIKLFNSQIPLLYKALKQISKEAYLDVDTMHVAVEKRTEFNFIHPDTGLKVDFFVIGNDELGQKELQRRVPKEIEGEKVYFISAEDLILSKLRWQKLTESQLQLEDVKSVLKFQKDKLDMGYLKNSAQEQSTAEVFNQLLAEEYGK